MRRVTYKIDFIKNLFKSIPNNIITQFAIQNEIEDSSCIARFDKEKLTAFYINAYSTSYGHVILKYSYPDFKFQYIYIQFKEKVDDAGHRLEQRFDVNGQIESEYLRAPKNKSYEEVGYIYIKTKSKKQKVYEPYIWGNKNYPINNFDEAIPYIETIPNSFKYFYKKNKPENKYIFFLTTNKKNS
jgi:hypothetical protein|tara:strand:- start:5371 stop:5925 length:555 start_codon:yes stop_codon:yes gene_type:complete